jgi:hypothetical protein
MTYTNTEHLFTPLPDGTITSTPEPVGNALVGNVLEHFCEIHNRAHSVPACAVRLIQEIQSDKPIGLPAIQKEMKVGILNEVRSLYDPSSALYLNQNEAGNLPQVFVSMSERELRVLTEALALTWRALERQYLWDARTQVRDLVTATNIRNNYGHHFQRLYQASAVYNRLSALYGEQKAEEENYG